MKGEAHAVDLHQRMEVGHPQRVVVMDERLDAVKADGEVMPGSGLEDRPVFLIADRRIDANIGNADAYDIGMGGVAVDLLCRVAGMLRRDDDGDFDAAQILVGVNHILVVGGGEGGRPPGFRQIADRQQFAGEENAVVDDSLLHPREQVMLCGELGARRLVIRRAKPGDVRDHVAQRIARLTLEVRLQDGLHPFAEMPLHVVEHEHERVIHMHVNIDDCALRQYVAVLVKVFVLHGVEGRLDPLHSYVLAVRCHRIDSSGATRSEREDARHEAEGETG